jgi:hypothetical protein
MNRVRKLNVLPYGAMPSAESQPEMTPEERAEFEERWAYWQAEATKPTWRDRCQSVVASALLVSLAVLLALLGYAWAQGLTALAGVALLVMQVGFLVALPFMGVWWLWQRFKRRSSAAE